MEASAAMMQSNSHPEELHLVDHFEFLRKRWRMVAATFAGFVAIAAVATYRLPPVYQAGARVLIGSGLPGNGVPERSSAFDGYFLERRSFETQLEIMRSEPVLERAATILGRIDHDTPPERYQAIIAGIKGAVSVDQVHDTRIVLLRARDHRPEGARDLANAIAEAYIAYSEEQRSEARRRSIAWLTSETAHLRENLRASEERLVDYLSREQIDSFAEETAGPAASTAASDALRAQMAAVETELSQLRQRYRERHPKLLDAQSRLENLRRRAAAEQERRAADHRKLIQYRILKRDADLDHEMYQVLLKKLKEADLSATAGGLDIRVLEPAKLPSVPVAPRTIRNLGVAAVLGLCLALGLAYGVESFDRTVRTPEDAARALGLPALGVIHRFEALRPDRPLPAETSGSLEGETFRALRTNLRFSHVDKPRRVVLVTSTGPEEGKSTVLANLAVSLAQSGRRTLVIDTDLRRPSLHRLFALPNARGLVDLLAGDASVEETIQSGRIEGLDVLSSGTLAPNPAELIESVRLHERIAGLREDYDYVLLDSPPAGGLIDASLLCSLADGVLFVVERGGFDLKTLRSALRQLERAGARLYGLVLNKAPRDESVGMYGYYKHSVAPAQRSGGEVEVSPIGAG